MRPIDGDALIAWIKESQQMTSKMKAVIAEIKTMPSPAEESFEWCHDCKEYDQDAHCCHRWTKQIRQTVDEIKANRPQGEWVDYEIPLEDGGAMPIQVCSLCKTFYPLAYTGGGHRFCPNCGAKMKGADDD